MIPSSEALGPDMPSRQLDLSICNCIGKVGSDGPLNGYCSTRWAMCSARTVVCFCHTADEMSRVFRVGTAPLSGLSVVAVRYELIGH